MAALIVQMQTPADPNGRRDDMYPVTIPSAVMFDNGQTLEQTIINISESTLNGGIIFSEADNKPSAPALWGEIWSDIHYK